MRICISCYKVWWRDHLTRCQEPHAEPHRLEGGRVDPEDEPAVEELAPEMSPGTLSTDIVAGRSSDGRYTSKELPERAFAEWRKMTALANLPPP